MNIKTRLLKSLFDEVYEFNRTAQDRYAGDILRLLKDIDKAITEQKLNEELARNED